MDRDAHRTTGVLPVRTVHVCEQPADSNDDVSEMSSPLTVHAVAPMNGSSSVSSQVPMSDSVCSIEEFCRLVKDLEGLAVTHPWKGHGSAVFLELGQLTAEEFKGRQYISGEACIWVQWDWRVEDGLTVLFGSSNSQPHIQKGIASLEGTTIQSVSIAGDIPELVVSFSNGHCLRTMVMVTGNPEWSVRVLDGRWLHSQAGRLLVGNSAYETTEEEERAFALAKVTAERWGTPRAEPVAGQCRHCNWWIRLDYEVPLLDYGVCAADNSPFDGKVVKETSGCPVYVGDTEA